MTVKNEQNQFITESNWEDLRGTVEKVNPEYAKMIDKLPLNKEHTFLRVNYPYGAKILNNGTLQLPNNKGEFINFTDPYFSSILKEKIYYSPIPVSISLNKAVEVFIETENRVVPLSLLHKGQIFGLWETLDPASSLFVEKLWQSTSGARTTFFLPKISDAVCHKRLLQQFKIRSGAPKDIINQWPVFCEIMDSSAAKEPWETQLLIMTKPWFDKKYRKDSSWRDFDYFLLNTAWKQSSHWRSKMYFELIWEAFSIAIVKRNLRPTQNQINTLKHLIGIGMGIFPGFRPAVDNSAVPVDYLQKVYTDIYGLKDYAPILMQPWSFLSADSKEPVYYSINFPTQLDYITKDIRSTLEEVRSIMRLNDTLIRRVKNEESHIFKLLQGLNFQYYHSENDELNQIKATSDIIVDDLSFAKNLEKFAPKEFATHASFLRGCVSISKNQK